MASHHPFRFGIVAAQAQSGDAWVTTARRVEDLGYATLVIPDTLGGSLAPLIALSFAAAATRTLRVGTYVLANDVRNPVLLAQEAATLDFLSGGRLELGIGAGRPGAEDDCRKLGIPFNPGMVRYERLAEALTIIKGLLSGQRMTTEGPHYTITDSDIYPQPIQQPHPPILVAAGRKRLMALAAQEADIVALGVAPNEPREVVAEKLDWLRQAAGDRFDHLEINTNLLACGEQVPPWVMARLRLDINDLVRSGSVAILMGTLDQMCDQLEQRRATLGVNYVLVSADLMETFAPVVERMAGR